MNCPFCNSTSIRVVKTGELFIMQGGSCYGDGVQHYQCENGHSFFAQTENEANRAAEQCRTAKML